MVLPMRGWGLRRSASRIRGALPARAIRLPWTVRTIRIPKLKQFRPRHGTDVAFDEAPLVHRKPAGKFSGGCPFPGAADIENQGSEDKLPGPLAERFDSWDEDTGKTLEAFRPLVSRGAPHGGTAAVPLGGSWRLGSGGSSRSAFRERSSFSRRRGHHRRPLRSDRDGLVGRWWSGGVRLLLLGGIQQAEPGLPVPAECTGQTADAGEGRSDSRSALGQPAAEAPRRAAKFTDPRCHSADLSLGTAQGPGASDDASADFASCVSDPNNDPRRLFALGCDPANPLASRGPVLLDVPVGRANAAQDPADPEPDTAEPRARFPDPGADCVEARRGLVEGVSVRRLGGRLLGAQVENRQTEVPRLGSWGADSHRNRVGEVKLSRCYMVIYVCNIRSGDRTGCDIEVGGPKLGAIPESAGASWVQSRGRLVEAGRNTGVGWRELGAIPRPAGRSWAQCGSRLARAGCDPGAGDRELGAIRESANANWVQSRSRLAEAGCDPGVGWPKLGAIGESADANWVQSRSRLAEAGRNTGVGWRELGAIPAPVIGNWVRYGSRCLQPSHRQGGWRPDVRGGARRACRSGDRRSQPDAPRGRSGFARRERPAGRRSGGCTRS